MITPKDLKEAIINGELDDHRMQIYDWLKIRGQTIRSAKESEIKSEIEPGFRMVLTGLAGKAKPLNGFVVEILEVRKTKAKVDLADREAALRATGGKYGKGVLVVPLVCLGWLRQA